MEVAEVCCLGQLKEKEKEKMPSPKNWKRDKFLKGPKRVPFNFCFAPHSSHSPIPNHVNHVCCLCARRRTRSRL